MTKYGPRGKRNFRAIFDHMVDELRHRDEGLRVAMDQAEATSCSNYEFLANMRHELLAALNAIMGLSEIIGKETYERPTLSGATDI